jgi:PmbA protein
VINGPHASAEPVDRLRSAASAARDMVVHSGVTRWEFYAKASTVQELVIEPEPPIRLSTIHETGVAVRTVGHGDTGFGAASGLDADAARVAVNAALASQAPLAVDPLPPSRFLGLTQVAQTRTLPLAGWATHTAEVLTAAILRAAERRLLVRRLTFQLGSMGWLLATGDGFVATHQDAGVSVSVDLMHRAGAGAAHREWLWVPDAAAFDAEGVASQICNRALLTIARVRFDEGVNDLLLHREVSAQLLAAIAPMFVPSVGGGDALDRLADRSGRLASSALTLVEDRSLESCPCVAPCDGEGLPTKRHLLLDHGVPRHRLASHLEGQLSGEPTRGGATRLSYRDYPSTGIGALCVIPDPGVSSSQLLGAADRSLYLLRLMAPVDIDFANDAYTLTASGVWLDEDGVAGYQPLVEIRGSLTGLLQSIELVGTDLAWQQTPRGFVSAPSLLARRQRVVG